jgi:hypothetical protein
MRAARLRREGKRQKAKVADETAFVIELASWQYNSLLPFAFSPKVSPALRLCE